MHCLRSILASIPALDREKYRLSKLGPVPTIHDLVRCINTRRLCALQYRKIRTIRYASFRIQDLFLRWTSYEHQLASASNHDEELCCKTVYYHGQWVLLHLCTGLFLLHFLFFSSCKICPLAMETWMAEYFQFFSFAGCYTHSSNSCLCSGSQ